MRIVVSGTHASGKSTLISDFSARHPEYEVLSDPFEDLDGPSAAEPDAGVFMDQLIVAAERLIELGPGDHVVAERGPLDFLAYLDALDVLGRPGRAPGMFRHGITATGQAMAHVDLLVVLPLTDIHVPADEDPVLRSAMDAALLDVLDDPSLTGGTRIVEVVGDPSHRLALMEAAVAS